MQRAMGNVIHNTLRQAAQFDHLGEDEAVLMLTGEMLGGDPPKLLMATRTAMLAVRWHRTKQIEERVASNPAGNPQ